MEIKNLEELINNICDDAILDTVITIGDLYKSACEITMDMLEENGMTLSEKSLIAHVLELHSDVLNDLIVDEFGIEECDEDCENCEFAE